MTLDVKTREYALEREQKTWRSEKQGLILDIQHLKAEKDILLPNIRNKRTALEGLRRSVGTLQIARDNLTKENAKLDLGIDDKQKTLNRFATKASDIETKIALRKENANAEVETYFNEAKQAADEQLAEALALVTDAETRLEAINKLITQAEESATGAGDKAKSALQELKDTETEVAKQTTALKNSLKDLKDSEQRQITDNSVLMAQNTDLKMDNIALETSSRDFKAYEGKAWKLLQAKDEELQGREAALEQREALRPRNKSFLPPLSE